MKHMQFRVGEDEALSPSAIDRGGQAELLQARAIELKLLDLSIKS